MNRRHATLHSDALGTGLGVIAYGHYGRPVLAFPSQQGNCHDYEDQGMVDAIAGLIEAGRVKLYCVDTIDGQTWHDGSLPLEERARRHGQYEGWILDQLVPFIGADSGGEQEIIVTGPSFGAFHAANFALKRADLFPLAICQSGIYDVSAVGWGERGEAVYFNNPADYVAHLHGVHRGVGRGDAERRQQVPLIADGMTRAQVGRARHAARVHPAASLDVVADPARCAARPGEPSAARPAVEIDRHVVARAPQGARQADVGGQPPQAAGLGRDDHLVEMGIAGDDGSRRRLHQVAELRVRVAPSKCPDHRGREDDVADEAQPDEQDLHYGSMVASSMSMTGMSSLIGYTRLHFAHLSAVPFFTRVT